MYNPSPPRSPAHPTPLEEVKRLAGLFAARTSPFLLPASTRRAEADLTDPRRARVREACQEEAPIDTPFALHELKQAIPHGRHTSPGQDRVTYSMLSHLGAVGTGSLLELYNVSLQAGALPKSWKEAVTSPIPKPGDPGTMRPISLLSCVGKVTERLVLGRLRWQTCRVPSLFLRIPTPKKCHSLPDDPPSRLLHTHRSPRLSRP